MNFTVLLARLAAQILLGIAVFLWGAIAVLDPARGDARWVIGLGAALNIGVFVFAGYSPATELFKDTVSLNEEGYVITDSDMKTNIESVYAAGDVCEIGRAHV